MTALAIPSNWRLFKLGLKNLRNRILFKVMSWITEPVISSEESNRSFAQLEFMPATNRYDGLELGLDYTGRVISFILRFNEAMTIRMEMMVFYVARVRMDANNQAVRTIQTYYGFSPDEISQALTRFVPWIKEREERLSQEPSDT